MAVLCMVLEAEVEVRLTPQVVAVRLVAHGEVIRLVAEVQATHPQMETEPQAEIIRLVAAMAVGAVVVTVATVAMAEYQAVAEAGQVVAILLLL